MIDLFEAKPSRATQECGTNRIREQKNAAVFANRISWRKITITSLTEVTTVSTTNVRHERNKIVTLNDCHKQFCMQARNRPVTFWQT